MQQGKGHHPLQEILPQCFPQAAPTGRVVEPIIGQLERDPQVEPKVIEGGLLIRRSPTNNRSDLASRGYQCACFVFDDPQIVGFGEPRLVVGTQLENLAFCHFPAGV